MILQEAGTISNISVAQNIFLGNERSFTKLGIVNRSKMIKDAQTRIEKFGITSIKAADRIDKYGFEDRKLMEIIRVVDDNTNLLIVDETTTALSHEGRELLYKRIKKMAAEGKAVVFISHDLEELIEVCNVLTVLRDGVIVGELNKEEMQAPAVRRIMVGREIMYHLIEELKKEGKSILLISEELTELIGMCDRIAIMKDFDITKEFIRSPELSE